MADTRVIIDCDPGTDDALALLLSAVYFRRRILCMISTYGNAALSYTHANLKGLAAMLKLRDIPILRGADCPMDQSMGNDPFVPTDYHGTNGLLGITLPASEACEEEEDGIGKLCELICRGDRVIYVALGPLTNLALLLERCPRAAEFIDEVVIMGGGMEIGNTDCGAEYNFSLDPKAVEIVLNSPVKKVLTMLDFTHTLAFSENEVREMVGAPRGELKNDDNAPHSVLGRIFYGNLVSSMSHGNEGAILHDAAAVAYLAFPKNCDVKTVRVRSDDLGRLFPDERGHEVSFIDSMNREIFALLIQAAFSAVYFRDEM